MNHLQPAELDRLLLAGETLDVEFKSDRNLNDAQLLEAAVCLANRPGSDPGWLLVGVEDDGTVTGARPRGGAVAIDPRQVEAALANRTQPPLTCRAEVVQHPGGPVLAVQVFPSPIPTSTADGKFLRRALRLDGKPQCVPYAFHTMLSSQAAHGLDYSALVVPGATWEDLDPLEFQRLRRQIQLQSGVSDRALLDLSDVDLAKALEAVEANHSVRGVRVAGLLLFGREESLQRLLPTHEAAFQVLQESQVVRNEFFRTPLLRLMDDFVERFRARNEEEEVVDLLRTAIPNYPERAFREAVANALVHRDYTRLGAVHVQWRQDQMEISNPGGFPEGVRLDNLLVTPPRPRNPLLANAFKRAGLVERTGRGIDIIFEEQLRWGRPAPIYERSTPTDVVVVLPGGRANLEFVKLVMEERQAGRPLSLDALLLLNHLWLEREINADLAAKTIQKSSAEARASLQRLNEAGLVEARGTGRGRSYHLAASVYARLATRTAYTRQRGFSRIQQEQMILQHVRQFGSISRKEAADLCRLGLQGAYGLLRQMVQEGKLEQVGTAGRYVRYQSPGCGEPS